MSNIFKFLKPILIAFLCSVFVSLLPSLSTPKHQSNPASEIIYPIDKEQQDCIDSNQTTAGMINCTNAACKKWENELNKNYTNLLKTLSPSGQETLRASQVAWLKYRDKQLALLKTIHENLDGTMYQVEWAQERLEITKHRALELNL